MLRPLVCPRCLESVGDLEMEWRGTCFPAEHSVVSFRPPHGRTERQDYLNTGVRCPGPSPYHNQLLTTAVKGCPEALPHSLVANAAGQCVCVVAGIGRASHRSASWGLVLLITHLKTTNLTGDGVWTYSDQPARLAWEGRALRDTMGANGQPLVFHLRRGQDVLGAAGSTADKGVIGRG